MALIQGSNPYLQGGIANLQGSNPILQPASSPIATPQPPKATSVKPASPSATSSVAPKTALNDLSSRYGLSGGTVYDKSTGQAFSNAPDFFKAAGVNSFNNLRFDTNYSPIAASPAGSDFLNRQLQGGGGSQLATPPAVVSAPKSAYLEFLRKQFDPNALNLASGNLNDLNKRTSEELLRARKNEDIIRQNQIGQTEQNQNYALDTNTRLSNRSLADLALAKGYQTEEYNRLLGAGSTLYSLEQAAQDRATDTLGNTATALLAQFEALPNKMQQDAYVRSKATELGLSIDQVNAALQKAIADRTAQQREGYQSVSEGEAIFDPATGQFVIKNPKTFAPSEGGAGNPYGLTNQQIDNISPIANAFRSEQIVQNYNVLAEAHNFVQSISNSTKNPSDDQALIYALAKALDPNSVVREGEYATAQKYSQSMAQQYGKSITQALAGTGFLSDQARGNIKKTIEERYNASLKNYQNVYNEYVKRINNVGGINTGADFLTNYGGAYGVGGGGAGSADDFINSVLGFNGVGNTLASTGSVKVSTSPAQPKPVLRVTNASSYPLAIAVNQKFPEGSRGGQCGVYARQVLNSFGGTYPPLGDSLSSKLAAVSKYGSPIATARLGSVVVTKENPTYGHVAVVVGTTPQGVIVTESNFKQSERVDTGRVIPWSKIAGVINPSNKA